MIVVNFDGGLGNQLFQYSLGLLLEERWGTKVLYTVDSYAYRQKRTFLLDSISTVPIPRLLPVRGTDCNFRVEYQSYSLRRIIARTGLYRLIPIDFFGDRSYDDMDNVLRHKCGYFHGYWQSLKSTLSARPLIKAKLDFELAFQKSGSRREGIRYDKTKAVSIHFRRGDFVRNPYDRRTLFSKNQEKPLSLNYYKAAVAVIKSYIVNAKFFVFSDDPKWATEVCENLLDDFEVLSSTDSDVLVDFHLMTSCSHHIIANSTFSWWAAFLGQNENSKVTFPRLSDSRSPFGSILIPDDWIGVDNC